MWESISHVLNVAWASVYSPLNVGWESICDPDLVFWSVTEGASLLKNAGPDVVQTTIESGFSSGLGKSLTMAQNMMGHTNGTNYVLANLGDIIGDLMRHDSRWANLKISEFAAKNYLLQDPGSIVGDLASSNSNVSVDCGWRSTIAALNRNPLVAVMTRPSDNIEFALGAIACADFAKKWGSRLYHFVFETCLVLNGENIARVWCQRILTALWTYMGW